MSQITASIEKPEELTSVQLWNREITAAEKELKKFYERGRNCTKKFLDERDALQGSSRWFNIYYANTQILESALYAQLPKPVVSRKYTDYNDDVARVAALIIERNITQDLDDPCDTFDSVMRHCVQDRLVPGLSQAWLRIETDTEDVLVPPTPGSDPETEPTTYKKITDQRVVIDYIFWNDFLWSPCRVWEERRWVARKAYMDRSALVKRFGAEKGNACPLNYTVVLASDNEQGSTPKEDVLKKAIVYEIWDRTTKKVFWYCKDYPQMLDEKDDPLLLNGFEPCPQPMLANISTSNTVPRPDYYMIQDQYIELDNINNRISKLVQACKVVGVYDKAAGAVSRMLTEGTDNELIPVDDWGMFAEKNGLKGTIDWLPLEQVVTALRELNAAREVIKGQIYELTGIADIVRGATKASETLGAQQIKAQFASVRIKKLQDEVARFAADLMRIKAELMVKHFDPEILLKKSNIMATGNDEWVEPAMELLTTEEGFEWRITVNADTLAQADYAMEKQDRIEMLSTVSGYLEKAVPVMTQFPQAATLVVSIMKWAIAGFKNADEIEGMLDRELTALETKAKEPPPPPQPSPEEQKLQAEMAKMQADQQMEMARLQAEQAMEKERAQIELTQDREKHALELQKMQMEMEMERRKLELELMAEKQRLMMDVQQKNLDMQFQRMMEQLKLGAARDQSQLKLESQNAQNEAALETKAQSAAIDGANESRSE